MRIDGATPASINDVHKEILKAYKDSVANKKPLQRTDRSKLVRVVIGREKTAALKKISKDEALEKFLTVQKGLIYRLAY